MMTGPPGSARTLSPEDAPGLDVLFGLFFPILWIFGAFMSLPERTH
jgi:hypothetical protein